MVIIVVIVDDTYIFRHSSSILNSLRMSWETKNYSKLGKQGKVEKKVWKADGWALEQRIWSEFEFRFAIKKSFNGDPEPEKNSIFLLFYSLTLCVVSLLYTTTRAILRAIANAPSTCQKSKPWKIFFATGKPQSDLTLVCVSLSCKQNQTSWSRLVWLLHHWQPHS